jgi:hypothetical protein
MADGVPVSIYIDDIATALANGYTSIRLYSATDPLGTFTLVTTITLVAADHSYSYTDTAGTADTWYRHTLYTAVGPTESDPSAPYRVLAGTLDQVIFEALAYADAGFTGTCSALGDPTYLVCDALLDYGQDAKYLEGGWIYRYGIALDSANAANRYRRVARGGFSTSTGRITPTRNWTYQPQNAEAFAMLTLLPPYQAPGAPYSWAQAARDGIRECRVDDRLFIATGDGATYSYDLSAYDGLFREEDVVGCWGVDNSGNSPTPLDVDYTMQGRYIEVRRNGPSSLTLLIRPIAPTSTEDVYLEVNRTFVVPTRPTDVTDCPLPLAARATVWKVFEHLQDASGRYAKEEARARLAFEAELSRHNAYSAVLGV